jgi:hypothetical protein
LQIPFADMMTPFLSAARIQRNVAGREHVLPLPGRARILSVQCAGQVDGTGAACEVLAMLGIK